MFPSDCFTSSGNGVIKVVPNRPGFNQGQAIFNCLENNKKKPYSPFYNLASVLTNNQILLFDKKKLSILIKETV